MSHSSLKSLPLQNVKMHFFFMTTMSNCAITFLCTRQAISDHFAKLKCKQIQFSYSPLNVWRENTMGSAAQRQPEFIDRKTAKRERWQGRSNSWGFPAVTDLGDLRSPFVEHLDKLTGEHPRAEHRLWWITVKMPSAAQLGAGTSPDSPTRATDREISSSYSCPAYSQQGSSHTDHFGASCTDKHYRIHVYICRQLCCT